MDIPSQKQRIINRLKNNIPNKDDSFYEERYLKIKSNSDKRSLLYQKMWIESFDNKVFEPDIPKMPCVKCEGYFPCQCYPLYQKMQKDYETRKEIKHLLGLINYFKNSNKQDILKEWVEQIKTYKEQIKQLWMKN